MSESANQRMSELPNQPENQPTNQPATYLLLAVLAIFLILGGYTSLHASQGPDEATHFYFTRFVAAYGRLPLTGAERSEAGYKADLPPLYYLLTGTIGRGVNLEAPPYLKITRDNPRLQLLTGLKNIKGWRVIPTEDPRQGEVLLWYLGRWTSLVLGLAGLLAVYGLLRLSQPDPWVAVAGTALLAFLTTYTYISGVISYESLTGALMAGYFILLFLSLRRPGGGWLFFGLGLLLGLVAATRQTPWILLSILPLYVLGLARFRRWSRHQTLTRLGLTLLGLSLTFGLWLLYILVYFNRVADLGWFHGFISPVLMGDGSDTTSLQIAGLVSAGEMGATGLTRQSDSLWLWAWTFFRGVWGPGWLAWLMVGGWAAAVIGAVRRWRQASQISRAWLGLLTGHLVLLMVFPLLRFIFSGEATSAMSQHILFPAGAALLGLLIWGWRGWFTSKQVAGMLLLLAALYLSQNIAVTFSRSNPPLPVRTVPFAFEAEQAGPIADFDEFVLLDYELAADSQQLTATFYWRVESSPAEDYRFILILLDEAGQPRARRIEQPVNGRYPTRAWLPGDRLRQTIELPVAGLPPGAYRPRLQILGDEQPHGQPITLERLTLAPEPLHFTDSLTLAGQQVGYTFWPQNEPAESLPRYGERATVAITAETPPGDQFRWRLVGPDGRTWPPLDQTDLTLTFAISPKFSDGDYRLRLEQHQSEIAPAHADSPPLFTVQTEPRQFEVPPIAQPVKANFAGYVSLLGYDVPQTRLQAGQSLPLTLYWQARRPIGANLIIFNDLIGPDGRQWGGQDRLARDVYSTLFWAPDELVTDAYTIQIDPQAPPGLYYLLVGLYLPVGQSAVSLPLVRAGNGQMSEVTHVTIGPFEVTRPGGE